MPDSPTAAGLQSGSTTRGPAAWRPPPCRAQESADIIASGAACKPPWYKCTIVAPSTADKGRRKRTLAWLPAHPAASVPSRAGATGRPVRGRGARNRAELADLAAGVRSWLRPTGRDRPTQAGRCRRGVISPGMRNPCPRFCPGAVRAVRTRLPDRVLVQGARACAPRATRGAWWRRRRISPITSCRTCRCFMWVEPVTFEFNASILYGRTCLARSTTLKPRGAQSAELPCLVYPDRSALIWRRPLSSRQPRAGRGQARARILSVNAPYRRRATVRAAARRSSAPGSRRKNLQRSTRGARIGFQPHV